MDIQRPVELFNLWKENLGISVDIWNEKSGNICHYKLNLRGQKMKKRKKGKGREIQADIIWAKLYIGIKNECMSLVFKIVMIP